jgi:hypothetical protein
MFRTSTIACVLIGAALVLGATACGGGGSSAGGQSAEETTNAEGGSAASGTLEGEVGPGFEIEVKQNGEDAESVKAGTYTLSVEDKGDSHNFHLIAPASTRS